MMEKACVRMLRVLLVGVICLSGLVPVATTVASAEALVSVLYECYAGNDLSYQESGFAPAVVGNTTYIESDYRYDATPKGGDGKPIYCSIDVGRLYDPENDLHRWGGAIVYFYDETAEIRADHMTVKNLTEILDTAWLSMDIMIAPDHEDHATGYVDLSSYYVVIGNDWGRSGETSNIMHYGVSLSNYLTESDIGQFRRICLPLTDFMTGDIGEHLTVIKKSKLNTATLVSLLERGCSFGVICYPEAPRNRGELNRLYLDNIRVYSGQPVFFDTVFSVGGSPVTSMQEGDVDIESSIFNGQGVWIVARYDAAGELVEIAALEYVDAVANFVAQRVTVHCEETDTIRTFLWKDLESIEPLGDCAQLLPESQ